MRRWKHILNLSIVVLAMAMTPATSHAQTGATGDAQGTGEVQLSILNLGVGGMLRAGDWAGIQVQMLDQGSSQREVILRVTIRDSDGDDAQYDRVVSANPGLPQSFWLYCWMPFQFGQASFEIHAFEAEESGGSGAGQLGYSAGRLIGAVSQYNPVLQEPWIAIGGMVGTRQLGIQQYGMTIDNRTWRPLGHELVRIAPGLTTLSLPDRWQGLVPLDFLVWGSSTLREHDPSTLSPERARALRHWVKQGGHLIVIMPPSDDPWYSGTHPLRDILPDIERPQRHDGVDYNAIRQLLTESADIQLPTNGTLTTFTPASDAEPSTSIPVLKTRAGETIAIRRLVGSGMVTVVGINLGQGELRRLGLPEAEPFWHRILGMRGEIKRPAEMSDQLLSDARARTILEFDSNISGEIAKTGRAIQGVFFGLIVFIIYWIVAGPGGFALLKKLKKSQHAWVAFVVMIAVFTALSWIGASMLRPKKVNITHLTLFEQVYGQPTSRARSWMSVMLPSYGQSEISLRNPDDDAILSTNKMASLLTPWQPSTSSASFVSGFPDNTGYRIESRSPDSIRVPTRATVKDFRVDWGGVSDWSMPHPIMDTEAFEETKLELIGTEIHGQLQHNLPGELKDLMFVIVSQQTPIRTEGQSLGQAMISRVTTWSPQVPGRGWGPGEVINLLDYTKLSTTNRTSSKSDYFTTAIKRGVDAMSLQGPRGSVMERLMAARMISQFQPPRYGSINDPVGNRLAHRRQLHGWDLGMWFTQPCLIVMGVLEVDAKDATPDGSPVPVFVNGKPVPASGKTLVTWIYPFPANPPRYAGVFDPEPKVDSEDDSEDN
ncbi:MAG: hypothetical protein JKY43_10390 [Phycisphaerales bacterium]|nr:hypothetical protein [Phycisphaerales bacterium]